MSVDPEKITLDDLVDAARQGRDREVGPDTPPPFTRSGIKRRQRRASPLGLLTIGMWVASIFGVIVLVRPLMAMNDWFGLLVILYLFPSMALMAYGLKLVQRHYGLFCPYCGATFTYVDLKNPREDQAKAREDDRRCGKCQAVLMDPDA